MVKRKKKIAVSFVISLSDIGSIPCLVLFFTVCLAKDFFFF